MATPLAGDWKEIDCASVMVAGDFCGLGDESVPTKKISLTSAGGLSCGFSASNFLSFPFLLGLVIVITMVLRESLRLSNRCQPQTQVLPARKFR